MDPKTYGVIFRGKCSKIIYIIQIHTKFVFYKYTYMINTNLEIKHSWKCTGNNLRYTQYFLPEYFFVY